MESDLSSILLPHLVTALGTGVRQGGGAGGVGPNRQRRKTSLYSNSPRRPRSTPRCLSSGRTPPSPELLPAIHKAWLLSKQPPAKQREKLALPQCEKRIKKDMRILASRHRSRSLTTVLDPANLIRQLSALDSSKRGSFRVFVSNAQGRAVCLTKELLLELGAQQELMPHAKEPVA